jgi:hypothetical protein
LLNILVLSYYRITIWFKNKRKPVQGIRFIDQQNIDLAQIYFEKMTHANFPPHIVHAVEVAMLSKNSPVVREHMTAIRKRSKEN